MAKRKGRIVLRTAVGLLAATVLMSIAPAPASAAGLFESFFGGLSRALGTAPPEQARAYAEPLTPQPNTRQERVIDGGMGGPRHAFCVRTCDGSYFPIRAHAGLSVAEACHAFCPACETRLYYGTTIDYAVARNGSRYTDLPNAYLYRKQMVAGCSCNGTSAAGLAKIAPKSDPTLRRGDIVVTAKGPIVYTGNRAKNFTPVQSYAGFSKHERAKLSTIKVTPPNRQGTAETPMMPSAAAWDFRGNRTAQR